MVKDMPYGRPGQYVAKWLSDQTHDPSPCKNSLRYPVLCTVLVPQITCIDFFYTSLGPRNCQVKQLTSQEHLLTCTYLPALTNGRYGRLSLSTVETHLFCFPFLLLNSVRSVTLRHSTWRSRSRPCTEYGQWTRPL